MIYTAHEYLKEREALTGDQAMRIHDQLKAQIGGDSVALELYDAVVQASVEYIQIRSNWSIHSKEENREFNDVRTEKHNKVIQTLDELAKHLQGKGNAINWRHEIGYEADGKYFRKRIGDFGCYIAFMMSLKSR